MLPQLSAREADRQYNARASIPDHPQIFERWRERSARARDRLSGSLGCRYGPSESERLDLFPAASASAPLLVFLHGGYWRSLDKDDFSFLAPPWIEAGVSVALVNYGLAPALALEDIVRQVLAACAWLHRHARTPGAGDDRLHLAGHSAGAHLAAMMAAAQWPAYAEDLPEDLIASATLVSGLYDLRPLAVAPFLQADLRLDEASALHLSPITYRPERAVPLLTAVGGRESQEFRRQSRLIGDAWQNCPRRHLVLPDRHHLNVIEALGEADSELFAEALALVRTV